MVVERATIEDAVLNGIDLSTNAFMLVHGWTAGPVLLEFVAKFRQPLESQPMTAEQLADEIGAEEGPLAICLRACCILGYTALHPETREYSLVPGPELQELERLLKPESAVAAGLRALYADVAPPFAFPSEEASRYLAFWEEHRPQWSKSRSRGLSILLDGMVLAPLLTSITYFARWDEEGQEHGRENAMDRFDFSKMDSTEQAALGDIFELLGVGTMNAKGIIMMSSKGSMALQRCYSYYVPISYSPLLAQLPQILFEDASWGFADAGESFEMEEHIDRILNVVGSGAQHRTLFKDLMHHVDAVFGGDSFEQQPQFIVDTGCGDGSLLIHIYEHIKGSTPRGKALADYPLTMVGVDLNEEPRVTTAVNLSKQNIPHVVLSGDVGKPAEIVQSLKKKKVDLAKTLHVRSFLDHDRPYIPPAMRIDERSATGRFVLEQLADFVHVDRHGKRIQALDLFASLVEHFARWANVLEVSFGLCMLEVMMLDVPTTRGFFNDCVSFPLDLVQCLSRQYLVSAMSFAMATAMTGLLPSDFASVNTYPEQGRYHRMLSQHLVRKPYRVRLAEPSDLEGLLRLEELAWPEPMRASPEVLSRRLAASPTTVLVSEIKGEVAAVLYMQRIESIEALNAERFMGISAIHSPTGRLLQLIAIAADPALASLNIGYELKEFALHLARLDSSVDSVVGVTRCGKEFAEYGGDMRRYVDEHFAGMRSDSTLSFHSEAGAQFVHIVEDYRPEDTQNEGKGVLVRYDVKRSSPRRPLRGVRAGPVAPKTPALELLRGIMTDLGYPPDLGDLTKSFFDYGMDSLELVRIRNKLSVMLDLELPATLLLDFPTVHDLAMQLDRDRRAAEERREVGTEAEGPEPSEQGPERVTQRDSRAGVSGWETLGATELLEMQQRVNETFALRSYQKRFTDIAKRCFPDMIKYILSIEHIITEVEGPILMEYGLIDDTEYNTVQRCREKLTAALVKHWVRTPELRANAQKMMHLTLQDQQWGGAGFMS